ncbi:GAF domain-containing protein [Streptomyces sp. NPDC051018]|uniref:GAF domain-containing protein n=1 Tax=Streptomyces sp. NPDC051018 TaxID=3365639 RepID=UPI00378C022B
MTSISTPAERARRLAELGLTLAPVPALDTLAGELAADLNAPYAMVNLITDRQTFTGLRTPPGSDLPPVDRTMSLEHGYCPALLDRRKALVLPDVCAVPRFAGNPVVDQIGIRSYAGAPLFDPDTCMVLGTVCAVGTGARPASTARDTLQMIKRHRDRVWQVLASTAG